MQELRFVGVENGAVIATDHEGRRYQLALDDALRNAVRPQPTPRPEGPRVPPRQIQQLIRAGRTVEQVVDETGADRETVMRFEAPIVAERGYVVSQARAVPVRLRGVVDPLESATLTFGHAIDDRLEQLEAQDVRWDAWKDVETGWHIGLDFTSGDVMRNALWRFDPKRQQLRPVSPAAVSLSQQEEPLRAQEPHLRAVTPMVTEGVIPAPLKRVETPEPAETARTTMNETADLLEELRRRRGERMHESYAEEAEFLPDESEHDTAGDEMTDASSVTPISRARQAHPSTGSITALHAVAEEPDSGNDDAAGEPSDDEDAYAASHPEPEEEKPWWRRRGHTADSPSAVNGPDTENAPSDQLEGIEVDEESTTQQPAKPRRPAMPTWDEIVFGTRPEDDEH